MGGGELIDYYKAFEKTHHNHQILVCSGEVNNGIFYTSLSGHM